MRQIVAYQSSDGQIFTDEDKAITHDNDLIGEEIDGLLRLVLKLDVNRYDLVHGFTAAMKNKKPLIECIAKIHFILQHESEYD